MQGSEASQRVTSYTKKCLEESNEALVLVNGRPCLPCGLPCPAVSKVEKRSTATRAGGSTVDEEHLAPLGITKRFVVFKVYVGYIS